MLLIGLAVYSNILTTLEVANQNEAQISAGWSFYIAWIALLITFVGAIYFGGATIYSYRYLYIAPI